MGFQNIWVLMKVPFPNLFSYIQNIGLLPLAPISAFSISPIDIQEYLLECMIEDNVWKI